MFDHVNMISCFDVLQNFPRMGKFASKFLCQGEMETKCQTLRGYPVVSIVQSRFDTSRFNTNRSRFDTHVKSFRYTCKVDSIQTEVSSIQPLFT